MTKAQTIIWDMDGVLYPYTDESRLAAKQAALAVLAKNIPGMDEEDLLNLSKQSYKEHGDSFTVAGELYGIDVKQAISDFHSLLNLDYIKPVSVQFTHAMRANFADNAILTMGNRPHAYQVVRRCALFEFFTTHNTITCEDFDPYKKRTHCEPFIHALDKMGCQAERAIMVEDSPGNLECAKKLGMTTVLVEPPADLLREAYIDFVYPTKEHFLEDFTRRQNILLP